MICLKLVNIWHLLNLLKVFSSLTGGILVFAAAAVCGEDGTAVQGQVAEVQPSRAAQGGGSGWRAAAAEGQTAQERLRCPPKQHSCQ